MTVVVPRFRSLAELVSAIPQHLSFVLAGNDAVEITGIASDSRVVQSGNLYCCIRGEYFDGHTFARDAVDNGARALLVESFVSDVPEHIAQVRVSNVRDVIGWLAAEIYDQPSDQLCVVGVTGTNGKTSTVSLVGDLLRALGNTVQVFGTLTGERTTPEAIAMQERLAQCVADGVTHVVMEVSSHALVQGRVFGTHFDLVAFTNLGHDHLDFHKIQEEYFAAKASLFRTVYADRAVVNIDDPHGLMISDTADIACEEFACSDASDVLVTARATSFLWRNVTIHAPIGGAFTVMNLLAAVTITQNLGYAPSDIARACDDIHPIRGRFELVPGAIDFDVVVDYAHTPEGLEEVLSTARALTRGQLIAVFGCGGNRDRGKRPVMGAIAARIADQIFVTSDNPRDEDPLNIIHEVCAGAQNGRADVLAVIDRHDAISQAIRSASRGDIVVIAGKGHETTQEIAGAHVPFNDVQVARKVLQHMQGEAK
jgi:UDP-N-acetylmuramoyl-L-alanyl-D-glutamate--2,6-diaminopimelate ligase